MLSLVMIHLAIAAYVINLVINVIHTIGYPGIFVLMLLEGMLLPIPSEIVMAFGGYLVLIGYLPGVVGIPAVLILLVVGSFGNLAGAMIAYFIGDYGGIPLISRYGKYVLLKEDTVLKTQQWFEKYGRASVFLTRLVPVFRTFISIPAGIAKMRVSLFVLYTFIGAIIWDAILIYLGFEFGANYLEITGFFDQYTYAAVAVGAILIVAWFYRALRRRKLNNKRMKM